MGVSSDVCGGCVVSWVLKARQRCEGGKIGDSGVDAASKLSLCSVVVVPLYCTNFIYRGLDVSMFFTYLDYVLGVSCVVLLRESRNIVHLVALH
ncbi:hypothetical protein E2C01_027377 [Portunus trituberculatus]|uniref:Uncharacterized protein n=1 Tax=Portunus trituberculatus TaxID=210409 RepID=A0A5B7ELE0_PORTR|nr:hypothetical protein [Portunus trituberculatus]